nr:immunoglobulin light chain junction region [Macaca mulatta]MOW67618.1 immunoglobulin light chain junction region [Macaca mulatta]MOW67770.1 immunoglobulin light chain junction region [Macaca mulatta]MOW68875.1 immunoglobulin light chain junction region [Macaca mulatta]MOW69621.1 immunoglobulin light chain junction region [Macaca mulatta]
DYYCQSYDSSMSVLF